MTNSTNPIRMIIPIQPRPKERPRSTRKGWHYTPKQTKEYEQALAIWVRKEVDTKAVFISKGPIGADITFHLPRPKRLGEGPRAWAPKRPDIDNLLKALMDALESVLYSNDSQLCTCRIFKVYHGTKGYWADPYPHIQIDLCSLPPMETSFPFVVLSPQAEEERA